MAQENMTRQTRRPPIRRPTKDRARIVQPEQAIDAGATYSSVLLISNELGLHRADVRKIFAIPERTQIRYEKANTPLSPAQADRVERFNRIYKQAVELFEDSTEARNWLLESTPPALNGQTPLEALATDAGAKKVEEVLYRAEYGIFG